MPCRGMRVDGRGINGARAISGRTNLASMLLLIVPLR